MEPVRLKNSYSLQGCLSNVARCTSIINGEQSGPTKAYVYKEMDESEVIKKLMM